MNASLRTRSRQPLFVRTTLGRLDRCISNQFTLGDVTGSATITDNCTAALVVTQDPPAGSAFGVGNTQVTITATDAAGNVGQCTTTLQVVDPLNGGCGICCGAGFVEAALVTCCSLGGRRLMRRRGRGGA